MTGDGRHQSAGFELSRRARDTRADRADDWRSWSTVDSERHTRDAADVARFLKHRRR